MKKNKLIILAAMLITAGISGTYAAHADIITEPQIDSNNILKILGETENGFTPVTIKIYEAEKDTNDISNISTMYYYIREIMSGADGKYEFQIPLQGTEKQFDIKIKEGKSDITERKITFTNSLANEALQSLKRAENISEIKTAVNSFISAVDFGFELYEENKTDIENSDLFYKIIGSVGADEVNSQSDLSALIEYASVICTLSNTDDIESFTLIFDKYSKQIFAYDSELESLYKDNQCVDEAVKADIIKRFYNKRKDESVYSSKSQFRNLIRESVILSCCEKNRGYTVFGNIINVLAKIYNSDTVFIGSYNKYNSMTSANKNEVALEVMGHSFGTTDDVLKKINEATSTIGAVQNPPVINQVGGGGGGGAGAGFMPQVGKDEADSKQDNTLSVNIPQKTDKVINFGDLENAMWASECISDLASREIIDGKGDGIFAPSDTVTREEFIKMLVNAIGLATGNDKCVFSDVEEDAWYYRYVAAGYANGIINGIDDMNFGIGKAVSRQDIAAMVGRVMKKVGIEINSDNREAFADDDKIAEYAKEYVYGLKALGIINGKENNMFDPLTGTTRAEAAKVISLMIEHIEAFVLTK